jgi:hypothetical protein
LQKFVQPKLYILKKVVHESSFFGSFPAKNEKFQMIPAGYFNNHFLANSGKIIVIKTFQ